MADKKISELVNLTALAADDEFVVVDADANATKRTTYGNLSSEVRGDIVDGDMPAGSIVQVVQNVYNTEVTIATGGSLFDTGLSATITPTSASNKILISWSQSYQLRRDNQIMGFDWRLSRNGSLVIQSSYLNTGGFGWIWQDGGSYRRDIFNYHSFSYLDAPASTSALTYSLSAELRFDTDNGSLILQPTSRMPSTMTLLEVVA